MVDEVDSVTRVQAAASSQSATMQAGRQSAAATYIQAVSDAIVLSARARQVMNEMSQGQTVAEAWLSQFTEPPDLTKEAVAAASQSAGTEAGNGDSKGSMQSAMNRAMNDLSWLFDAMSPPRVDTNAVAKVLAERMAADAVGTNPPLPQVIARAENTKTTPALYVENLSIITGIGGTTATVDRVALTTIDPTLAQSAARGGDRPLVLDVGGEAAKVATESLPPLPGEQDAREKEARQQAEEARQRALLIIRQGGQALPEGTLQVKLDVLLPL